MLKWLTAQSKYTKMNDQNNLEKKTDEPDDLPTKIDSFKAADIARKFFEQYNSGVEIKHMELKNNVWRIVVGIDLLFEQIREIKIDARTGVVIEYS